MSFGKLYGSADNAATIPILAVAKAYDIPLELVETSPGDNSADYLKISPTGKIPSFEGKDGYILIESMAIAIYVTSQNEKTTLLGKTKQDYASILCWMSFVVSDLAVAVRGWVWPLKGMSPYNKKAVEDQQKAALKLIDVFEQHLLAHTYLVGERVTLADIFTAGLFTFPFKTVLDKKFREDHPNLTRWYETVYNQPILSAVLPKLEFIDEAIKYQPPKKEAAPKKEKEAAPKAAPKAKAKEQDDDDEEEEDKPAPKPKHPLESLEKPSMIMDDWKRKYSNEDLRSIAMPWFWEHFKPEEYSLWRIDYKYNEELTQVFMSANLIGGFFARLEASRKYLFGMASVYGKANDSVIVGAFLVRGQDAEPAFDVAPDFDSYEFTKLDPSKKEDREFVEDQWEAEKSITVKDKEYPYADGKVFK
ncbi:MAG: hypothetical protein M1823_005952 [Watsoniomyces obsoletus]|nr:MAG: hypothetical protein M1823_005952 [Watsoniomyces obsoletus]